MTSPAEPSAQSLLSPQMRDMLDRLPVLLIAFWATLLTNVLRWGTVVHYGALNGLPLDDAYIYLQYSDNLLAGHGLAFNAGEVSCGVTGLLWLMGISGLRWLQPEILTEHLVHSLGMTSLLLMLILAGSLILRARGKWRVSGYLVLLLLGTNPDVLMQGISGLETPLGVMWILLAAHFVHDERPAWGVAGLAVGLAALTRPDYLAIAPLLVALPFVALRGPLRQRVWASLRGAFGVAVLAVPTGIMLWWRTGYPLPTTFMGKPLHTRPGLYDMSLGAKLESAWRVTLQGWQNVLSPPQMLLKNHWWPLLAAAMLVYLGFLALRLARRRPLPADRIAILLLPLLGWPLLYGLSYPVSPFDGGYYHRYFLPTTVALAILGGFGIAELLSAVHERLKADSVARPAFRIAVAALLWVSLLPWPVVVHSGGQQLDRTVAPETVERRAWAPYYRLREQALAHHAVYKRLVMQNAYLREQAAYWINAHLPESARLLVGRTGLGVVGRFSNRYVLDEGALINPDLHWAYREAQTPAERAAALREYMIDHNLGYYVSGLGDANRFADPAEFVLVQAIHQRRGEPWEEPKAIGIYRFEPRPTTETENVRDEPGDGSAQQNDQSGEGEETNPDR